MVGIIANMDAEPEPLRKWVSGEVDVRDNKQIQSEIGAFLKEHGVQQISSVNRIIGCPHEEGSDYLVGAKCQFCPFWRSRNRFTHEPEEN